MARAYPGGNGVRALPVEAIRRLEARGKRGEQATTFEVAVSSETPVVREGWSGRWREILGHDPGEVEMDRFTSGRAAVLVDHRNDQVGVVTSARIDSDRVLRAEIRFSRSARGQEIEADVADGIRANVSIGYLPRRAKLIEEDPEKGDLWRIVAWEPLELSIVAVPADDTVGVGRNVTPGYPLVEVEDGMSDKIAVEPGARDGRREVEEIYSLAAMNGMVKTRAAAWIEAGLTPEQVSRVIASERGTRGGHVQPHAEALDAAMRGGRIDGMTRRDAGRYSYARAIAIAAGLRDPSINAKPDGVEWETHRELERTMPGELRSQRGGILVPLDLRSREQAWEQRTLQSNIAGKGAETIFGVGGELIELLRARTVVAELGARILAGLNGPVSFPKQTAAVTAAWTGENPATPVPDSDLLLGLVTMAQKTLMANTAVSRQLIVQAGIDIEQMIRSDITEQHARAIDRAAIHGLGAASQPMGIYLAPDVNVRAVGGVPDLADIMALVEEVAKDNALTGRLAFATTPSLASKLRQTLEFPAVAGSLSIWQGGILDGEMVGFRSASTTQISSTMLGSAETGGTEHGLIFGDWSQIVIGLFSVLELVVDPFSAKRKGLIEISSFQMVDLILRHGESFAKGTGATAV